MHQRSGRKHFRWHHCQERIPGVYLRDIHTRQSFCDIRMHALSTTCRRNQYLQMQMSFLYLGSVWSHQIRRWVSKNDGVVEEVVDTTLLITSNGSLQPRLNALLHGFCAKRVLYVPMEQYCLPGANITLPMNRNKGKHSKTLHSFHSRCTKEGLYALIISRYGVDMHSPHGSRGVSVLGWINPKCCKCSAASVSEWSSSLVKAGFLCSNFWWPWSN